MERTHGSAISRMLMLAASLLAVSGTSVAAEIPAASIPIERHVLHLNDNAWINDIGSLLYADPDNDGYFSGLSLSIDVDSSYNQHEVYVIVDIIDEVGVTERLHTTRSFHVYGRSITDEYRLDIDLVQNYYPGIYDLQIILVDARDNRILDQVNAGDFKNLRALPLESQDNQTVNNPVIDRPIIAANDDVRVTEYAGSSGLGILVALFISVLFKFFRFNASQTTSIARRRPSD